MAYALPALHNSNSVFAAALARVRAFAQGRPRIARGAEVLSGARANVPVQPQRLDSAEQWAKLRDILGRAASGAAAADELQSAATRQLDLAQYGLTTLVDELSAVMTIPGRKSRTATVHVFGAGHDLPADAGFKVRDGRALAA